MLHRSSHAASPTMAPLVRVFAARAARAAFGAVLIAGAPAVVAALFLDPVWSGYLLVSCLPLAVLVWLVVRLLAPSLALALARQELAFGGGPSLPVSLMASPGASSRLRLCAGRLERPSYALPLVGLALLGPLSLHAPVVLTEPDAWSALGTWILLSALFTGLAHLTLAAFGVRFAHGLYAGTLKRSPEREGFLAVGGTVVASLIPGALAAFIPPLVVAFTGALFVPATFIAIARTQRRERALLAEHQGAEAI